MIKAWLIDNGPLRGASPICVTQSNRILFIIIKAFDGSGHVGQAKDGAGLLGNPPGFTLWVQNYSDLDSIEFKKINDLPPCCD
jgi:hypothetical protein